MVHYSGKDNPSYDRFYFLVNAPALFSAVATAVELDIFAFLSRHPGSGFERIREHADIPAHQLRVLLQAVCSTGLLERTEQGYFNQAVAEELLASNAADSWKHIVLGWQKVYYPSFIHLTGALRSGKNIALADYPGDEPTLYQRLSRNPGLEAIFHRAMSAFTLRSADALADRPEFDGVRHLLDVGGGDGATAALLLRRHRELTVTVLDMPSVSMLGQAGEEPESEGRLRFRPGDIFDCDFPPGIDAILFSHVLEIFSAEQIAGLLKKAYDALPTAGKVFIYGYNVSDDETEGIFSARLGLYLNALASGHGMAYPACDYERWLRATGFSDVQTVGGLPFEHGLCMGTKDG